MWTLWGAPEPTPRTHGVSKVLARIEQAVGVVPRRPGDATLQARNLACLAAPSHRVKHPRVLRTLCVRVRVEASAVAPISDPISDLRGGIAREKLRDAVRHVVPFAEVILQEHP